MQSRRAEFCTKLILEDLASSYAADRKDTIFRPFKLIPGTFWQPESSILLTYT